MILWKKERNSKICWAKNPWNWSGTKNRFIMNWASASFLHICIFSLLECKICKNISNTPWKILQDLFDFSRFWCLTGQSLFSWPLCLGLSHCFDIYRLLKASLELLNQLNILITLSYRSYMEFLVSKALKVKFIKYSEKNANKPKLQI